MPPKAPSFDQTGLAGVVQTQEIVQIGCIYCLSEGLQAPAERHVTYLYQGTSYCGRHLSSFLSPQAAT